LRGVFINVLLSTGTLKLFLNKICNKSFTALWLTLCFVTQNLKPTCKEFSILKMSSDDKLWKSLSVASDSFSLKIELISLQLLTILALQLLILALSFSKLQSLIVIALFISCIHVFLILWGPKTFNTFYFRVIQFYVFGAGTNQKNLCATYYILIYFLTMSRLYIWCTYQYYKNKHCKK